MLHNDLKNSKCYGIAYDETLPECARCDYSSQCREESLKDTITIPLEESFTIAPTTKGLKPRYFEKFNLGTLAVVEDTERVLYVCCRDLQMIIGINIKHMFARLDYDYATLNAKISKDIGRSLRFIEIQDVIDGLLQAIACSSLHRYHDKCARVRDWLANEILPAYGIPAQDSNSPMNKTDDMVEQLIEDPEILLLFVCKIKEERHRNAQLQEEIRRLEKKIKQLEGGSSEYKGAIKGSS